jgi:DNA polymerase
VALVPTFDVPVIWLPQAYGLTQSAIDYLNTKGQVFIGETIPKILHECLRGGYTFEAHNAEFEYAIWNKICSDRYGWPRLELSQLSDTMAICARCGLPQSLANAATVLRLGEDKDMGGSAIMKQMCKPRKDGEYIYTEEKHTRLIEYCIQDNIVTQKVGQSLPRLPESEQKIWELTVKINERGITVDRAAIKRIIDAEETNIANIGIKLAIATDWQITDADMKRSAFLVNWLKEQGVECSSIDAASVTEMLQRQNIPEVAKTVLEARQQLGRSATAKFRTMLDASDHDGRMRGMFTYYGASKTGRFAGRLVQPHNLVRPVMEQGQIEDMYALLDKGTDEEIIEAFSRQLNKKGKPLSTAQVLSSMVRGALTAKDGYLLMAADYAAIEARGIAFLAGCVKSLQIFDEFDKGVGADPYKVMAADIFGVPVEKVDSSQRQLGKQTILGCIAKGTPVLTDRGWIAIELVTLADKVFDGDKFVTHDGLIDKGVQKIVEPFFDPYTPDHKIFTGEKMIAEDKLNFQERMSAYRTGEVSLNKQMKPEGVEVCVAMSLFSDRISLDEYLVNVYDIYNAGDLHRFMILTGLGPLIVSNCGYGMSAKKFMITCEGYGIQLPEPPPEYVEAYDENFKIKDKDPEDYCPKGQFIVDKYRNGFPEIRQYWYDIGDAAKNAVLSVGEVHRVGGTAFKCVRRDGRQVLICLLPSGRMLWYQNPSIKPRLAPWGDMVDTLHYECMHQMTNGGRKWGEISTHGAHLVENICQAVCRDLLCHSLMLCEANGFPVVTHVHDEVVVEVPSTFTKADLAQFEKLVAKTPDWAKGFPVSAKGWLGFRYRKD